MVAVAALVVAGCGGDDDDGSSVDEAVDEAVDETSSNDGSSDDGNSDDDDRDDSSDEGPGFGNFESGEIVLTGAEEVTYAVGDPALGFISGGGCGGENYGISVNVQNAEAQVTMAQISAGIDEDMSGGRTGTFPVEELSLIVIPDGDMMSSRTYEGPGTMEVIEHDNAAPDFILNDRRTVLSITGTLEASGPDDPAGTVELAADLVWVMGCP
jgi:hypothetical protein